MDPRLLRLVLQAALIAGGLLIGYGIATPARRAADARAAGARELARESERLREDADNARFSAIRERDAATDAREAADAARKTAEEERDAAVTAAREADAAREEAEATLEAAEASWEKAEARYAGRVEEETRHGRATKDALASEQERRREVTAHLEKARSEQKRLEASLVAMDADLEEARGEASMLRTRAKIVEVQLDDAEDAAKTAKAEASKWRENARVAHDVARDATNAAKAATMAAQDDARAAKARAEAAEARAKTANTRAKAAEGKLAEMSDRLIDGAMLSAVAHGRWSHAAVLAAAALEKGESPERRATLDQALRRGWTRRAVGGVDGASALAWSPDGAMLAVGDRSNRTRLVGASTGAVGGTLTPSAGERVGRVGWSPDGKTIRVASASAAGVTRSAFDPADGSTRVDAKEVGAGEVLALTFAPKRDAFLVLTERRLVVVSRDGTAGLDADGTEIAGAAWSPDGERIAMLGSRGRLTLLDRGLEATSWRVKTGAGASHVAWSPAGDVIATAGESGVALWKATDLSPIATLDAHDGEATAIAWRPDGAELAVASSDGRIRIFAAGGAHRGTLEGLIPAGAVTGLAWSPDGSRLGSGSADGAVRVWDATTRSLAGALVGHGDAVAEVTWASDGRIASRSERGEVCIWTPPSPETASAWARLDPAQLRARTSERFGLTVNDELRPVPAER